MTEKAKPKENEAEGTEGVQRCVIKADPYRGLKDAIKERIGQEPERRVDMLDIFHLFGDGQKGCKSNRQEIVAILHGMKFDGELERSREGGRVFWKLP